ncbi:MAG TPA: hypothetical protein VFB79_22560 [Candidatus Angelobacter sp.]|nr:hypothetical protein [Candidatus Angelobacter sp.]
MKARFLASAGAAIVLFAMGAMAQDNGTPNDQSPVLKTRPRDSSSDPFPPQAPAYPPQNPNSAPAAPGGPPNAVPDGSRFIVKLRDTLDTKTMDQGKHFKAELREDLITPTGLIIPKGRTIKGHVAQFERGFTGARIQIALDEIETRKGWVPLIATVTGVPGDPSIKSTGEEGELYRKGPDKKKVLVNAAIGAGVGAASGAAAAGTKGAAMGAVAGAGLGSGSSLLFKGNDMKLEKGTQLEVRLDRDLVIPTH